MVAPLRNALRVRPFWIALFAAACPFFASPTHAQSVSDPRSSIISSVPITEESGFFDASISDPGKSHMLRVMAEQRNQLRQRAIADETARLLALAEQLKIAVDQSDNQRLSLAAIHTAAQIEKLAKTVEKKMRETDTEPTAP
jgi:hypothetical protein